MLRELEKRRYRNLVAKDRHFYGICVCQNSRVQVSSVDGNSVRFENSVIARWRKRGKKELGRGESAASSESDYAFKLFPRR